MANLFAQLAPRKGSHPKNPFGAEDGPAQRLARFESTVPGGELLGASINQRYTDQRVSNLRLLSRI